MFDIKWGPYSDFELYKDALSLRLQVFVQEQGVSEVVEIDDYEKRCLYGVLYDQALPIATVRLRELDDQVIKLQRFAVIKDYRKQGTGSQLLNEVDLYLVEQGKKRITLSAQVSAIKFYQKNGYEVISDSYLDAGILHKTMTKELN